MQRERQTKIVVTLGPATDSIEKIDQLFLKGVDVFRLNFSHGKPEEHKQRIQIIRSLEQKYNCPTTILLDLQGPKLRVGIFEQGKVVLKEGQVFCFDTFHKPGNNERVELPHPEIFGVFKPGQKLLLDDGKITVEITESGSDFILTNVIKGGILSNKKGVNLPDCILPIPALTQKDKEDLAFGLTLGVDWVALSFVQSTKDVMEAKKLINNQAKLAVKIEKPQAIAKLDKIVDLSDGVLIARGDLGVEMTLEDVPILQRKIIQTCRNLHKPVIVATQMLESMINDPSPTRAEVSDVATAIFEGADAVMLSAETAVGKYPIEAVEMMDCIIKRVEKEQKIGHFQLPPKCLIEKNSLKKDNISEAVIEAVRSASYAIDFKTVVSFCLPGETVLKIASSRPQAPILALTTNLKTARYLHLAWGVQAVMTHDVFTFPQMAQNTIKTLTQLYSVKKGDLACIILGQPFEQNQEANSFHILKIDKKI
jgi:pyruvate kinase